MHMLLQIYTFALIPIVNIFRYTLIGSKVHFLNVKLLEAQTVAVVQQRKHVTKVITSQMPLSRDRKRRNTEIIE